MWSRENYFHFPSFINKFQKSIPIKVNPNTKSFIPVQSTIHLVPPQIFVHCLPGTALGCFVLLHHRQETK